MYEIRVYNQRYNVNPDYYTGDDDIKKKWIARTPREFIRKWKKYIEKYEGDTYSLWDDGYCFLGGAYDEWDIDYINDYFDIEEEM